MATKYKHTQFGWITTLAAIAGLVALGWLAYGLGIRAILGVAIVVLLPLLSFCILTTEVTDDAFRFHFGFGLFGKRIARFDIASCRVVTNPWWYGWGIHLTPRGWLYNVSGREAVEIDLRNGRRLRVGSDEPEALCAALSAP